MGTWNFTIDLKINTEDINTLIHEYRKISYQQAFHFGVLENSEDDEFKAGISSVIDNFLPSNHLIYNFLSTIDTKERIYIKTREIIKIFDFEKNQNL